MAYGAIRKNGIIVKRCGNRTAFWMPDADHLLSILAGKQPREGVCQYLLSEGLRRFGADAGFILENSLDGMMLRAEASQGLADDLAGVVELPISLGVLGEALRTLEPIQLTDLKASTVGSLKRLGRRERDVLRRLHQAFRSALIIPLVHEGEVFGLLVFCYRQEQPEPHQARQMSAARFGRVAGSAMANLAARGRSEEGAAARERASLARDLHDTVAQRLFSASVMAGVLPELWEADPEEARRRTAELFRVTREAQAEMRTLLVSLRPATLAEAGLGSMLRRLGQSVAERSGVSVEVTVEERREVPPEVQVAIYRVAQEALNNVVKHAGASRVWLVFHCLEGQAHLSVSDNGGGFDPCAVPAGHLGLGIMQERAGAVGGRMEVVSRPGFGTTVSMVWKAKQGRWRHEPAGADSGRDRG